MEHLTKKTVLVWLLVGLLLIAAQAAIRFCACKYAPASLAEGWYGLFVVAALVISGATYLILVRKTMHASRAPLLLLWIILIGLAGRFLSWGVVPPIEDDFYRYFWDGAVCAQGETPYAFSPEQFLATDPNIPESLKQWAASHTDTLERINHPKLRTIYPPLAQAYFLMACVLRPFHVDGLRMVTLLIDAFLAMSLFLLLRRHRLAPSFLALYWWNPLIWYELYFRLHYDILLMPLLVGFVWTLHRKKLFPAAGFLALGVAARLWPVLLAPFLLFARDIKHSHKVIALLLFVALCAASLIPYLPAIANPTDSGLYSYTRDWQANEFLFIPFRDLGWKIRECFHWWHIDGRLIARGLTTAILLGVCCVLARFRSTDLPALCYRIGVVILIMLLLSPTVYPWYYTALLPLAAFAPRLSLLFWTVLLPLSYLSWLGRRYIAWRPDLITGAILHLPVWFFLVRDWIKYCRNGNLPDRNTDVSTESH